MSVSTLSAHIRLTLVTLAGALLFGALPALAQSETPAAAPTMNDVVVTIGDETITEADIAFAAEDLSQELSTVPVNQRRAFLVAVLIDMKVMAEAARAEKLDESDLFKRRLAYLEDRSLRRVYITQKVNGAVTDEAVQVLYDDYVSTFKPAEEVRARHILVSTEEDAKSVKAEIDGGKPFEMAALEYSQDGSSQNGGDLGYFDRSSPIVQPFMDAAFALEVGQVSDPVQTQFGWHIIRVDDKRMSSPAALDELKPQLQQQVMLNAFSAETKRLKDAASISFADPALEAAVKAEDEAVNQSEEAPQ